MAQINKPNTYFNPVLYTGTGATQSITGVNFQPDFTWIKNRNSTIDHNLFDSVRGVGKQLQTNTSGSEITSADALSAFGSDGFTITGTGNNYTNVNTYTYASWNWLAGGTAVSNTDGSITSQVSANQTAGFSIVSYTGSPPVATVGHGLGVAPSVMILKDRDAVSDWIVFHSSLANNQYLDLNNTNAVATDTNVWNNTAPTSSVFTVGDYSYTNPSSRAMIAYCFAEKKGFSKFGSYTGNGSADGTFVYTGFKPAFIFSKRTDSAGTNWTIWDNKRSSSNYNPTNKILHPNVTNTENTADDTDFLSNGFKLRATALGMNASGGTYIYMAFAENPLVGTNNIPATAR